MYVKCEIVWQGFLRSKRYGKQDTSTDPCGPWCFMMMGRLTSFMMMGSCRRSLLAGDVFT